MRETYGSDYPRFMVWENVPGAFSSNKGLDFAAVLEETIRIVEPEAPSIEVPAKGWPTWGCYRDVDGRWSVAWRTLDAQYWGVPQRRRRIALVADFGGGSAPEILFERKSVSGDSAPRGEAREGIAADAERSVGKTGTSANHQNRNIKTIDCRNNTISDVSGTLQAKSNGGYSLNYINPIYVSHCGGEDGGQKHVAAFSAGQGAKAGGIGYQEEIAPSLKAGESGTNRTPCICVKEQYLFENHSQDSRYKGPLEVCPMLPAHLGTGGNNTPFVCIPINDKATRY